MATTPNFTKTTRSASVVVSTANANRDGTGTIATLITGVTLGTRITRILAKAIGTTTAGMLRLFLFDGTNYRLFAELDVLAVTPSATVKSWEGIITFGALSRSYISSSGQSSLVLPGDGIILPSTTRSIAVSTHNAESFHVTAEGGDFDV